jgi:hypothetical protein
MFGTEHVRYCQVCGCTPCKKCGAPIENRVCTGCGKPAKECTCK